MNEANILIVDDNPGVLSAGKLFLKRHFAEVDTTREPEEIPGFMKEKRYDIILLDMNFGRSAKNTGQEGFQWLGKILELDPSAVVVLITAYGDVELAVRAIKNGATDFVLKPWDNDKLLATLHSALKLKSSQDENTQLKSKQAGRNLAEARDLPEMIFQSRAMQQIYETVQRIAETDANVLLLGENGTGKDLIAQAIHSHSRRAQENFVKVDLGAITETLFESELFGHVKGAFTDAREDRPGRFEAADGGTIFLDEIGNLTLGLQAKLLTVLQNRTVTRVGSNRVRPVNVRVIAATNQNLYEAVKNRTFRQDLLYRINTIEIQLPPLRERTDDIEPLAQHFLKEFARKYNRPVTGLSAALLKEMLRYPWPGNVRELQHAVERAVIMAQGEKLQPEDFFFRQNGVEEHGAELPTMNLDDMEKQLIMKALQKYHGNITEAAAELGLTRASLYRRLEKYHL
ncbi:MAG: sigma-54-dependent Fis family transcriptional regulator [Haliscomenobacteraceae bacterium CHB4]|nr:sigma-54-dependent Fis family transcriptional regulator [Haliscomenobacteraceae bacterium CHB4]